ncbi:cyclic nucleotide-binding/CBS domain-containing protein [Rhodobacteraceae bacterium CCMM004]|nr:cyclic nucleotide-binding/CBS domain-containing protein [Rhodobacteraceae bacterium CCMM004]
MSMTDPDRAFLATLHPYDRLPSAVLDEMLAEVRFQDVAAGSEIYAAGAPLPGLYVIQRGTVDVRDPGGTQISRLEAGNSFGERGLLRDGMAVTTARADTDCRLMLIPTALFARLRDRHEAVRRFFDRSGPPERRGSDLATVRVADLMVPDPATCTGETPVIEAARTMRDRRISCLCVTEGPRLTGIVTVRDLSGRVLAEGRTHDTPVAEVMTPDPRTLPPSAIGSDVLHLMMEHGLGHLPIVSGGELAGIVTQTDLTRFQALSSAGIVEEVAWAGSADDLPAITARIPQLLLHLVAAGHRHEIVTRLITDIADVVTRRLLSLAEAEFGPPPVRYVWLACGSQGRQEQTGVSDQDNCMMIEDGASAEDLAYFEPFAAFVSRGLDACGYVFCPGDMMATNPRWRQPVSVWREYFRGWIANPGKEAQMLASVMFDLRAIGGDTDLFDGVQADVLEMAAANSIFTAHMATNALTHATPLGLLRGFATIRSGEHRNTIDMKMNGVVPVVDLARMYALQKRLTPVNTRARLEAAIAAQAVSRSGGRALLDGYDLIAQTRLEHQAGRVKRGLPPDNYLPPAELSDFERSHLRDAFVVVKTMQSALMSGRGVLG